MNRSTVNRWASQTCHSSPRRSHRPLQPLPGLLAHHMPSTPKRRQSAPREPLLGERAINDGYSPDAPTPRQLSLQATHGATDGDEEDEAEEGDNEYEDFDDGGDGAGHDGESSSRVNGGEYADGAATGALSEPEYSAGAPPASEHELTSDVQHHARPIAQPAEMAARHAAGYSSDTTRRDAPHMPRIAPPHAGRQLLSFGGATATTRRPASPHARGGGGTHRRDGKASARVPARKHLGREHADHHQLRPMADPLVWTGGSPPSQPVAISGSLGGGGSSAFAGSGGGGSFAGLPPLLAGLESANPPSRTPSASKVLRCSSYCCALGIDLMLLYRALSDAYGLPCRMHKDGLNAVLHATEANGRDGDAHSFFFSYGCVVTWGLSEAQEREMLSLLTTAGCAQEVLDENEVDDFGYTHMDPSLSGGKPGIAKDVVYLSTLDTREKLAVSFALAQSVKLGVFERTVEQTIQETRSIPERMAIDGKIRKMGRTSITKRIGQLFVDRASINLHSDILDHPEFFWEDDEWLPLYLRAAKYLEIDRRAEVLNKRLDIIKELFDMLANELNVSHSNKLEWIIIVLIVLEVLFQVLALVLEYGVGD